jgi:hypothetical protein
MTLRAPIAQLKGDYQLEDLVADSALYTAQTLPTLNDLFWIMRVAQRLTEARQAIQVRAPGLMGSLDRVSYQAPESSYAGVRQRWGVVYPPEAYQRAINQANRDCLKQSTADCKAFEALCRKDFALCGGCQAGAD